MIRMMGPLRILKGTLGRTRVVSPFKMQWGHFRRKRLISSRRVFRNCLISGEELAKAVVSARGDVPMSLVLQVTDMGDAMIPPVMDRLIQQTASGSVSWDAKTDEVSVVSWPMCVRPIHICDANTAFTHSIRICLLCPDGAGNLQGGSVGSQRLNNWLTVRWDPGIVDYRVLSVYYDFCLPLFDGFVPGCDVFGPSLGRVVCMDCARCWVLPDNCLGRTVFTTVTSTLYCGEVVCL